MVNRAFSLLSVLCIGCAAVPSASRARELSHEALVSVVSSVKEPLESEKSRLKFVEGGCLGVGAVSTVFFVRSLRRDQKRQKRETARVSNTSPPRVTAPAKVELENRIQKLEDDLARRELEVQQTLTKLKSMEAKAAAAAQAKAAADEFARRQAEVSAVMQKLRAVEEREASIRRELQVRATLTKVQGMEMAEAKAAKDCAVAEALTLKEEAAAAEAAARAAGEQQVRRLACLDWY
jgi:hypothetical protein